MDNAPRPDAATACRLIREYFLSRTDIVAVRQTWIDRKSGEIVSQPRPVIGDQHLDALLVYHVAGPDSGKAPPLYYFNRRTGGQVADGRGFDRVGTYAVAPDDSCVWLCLDFDGPSHPLPLADPQATMLACVETCRALGVPAHIEKSGSGHGWHIWVFFDAPVPAVDARLLGHFIAPTGHVLATGESADVRIGRGIECFPKQNSVSDKPFRAGNMMWMPHWFGAKDGGNQFYQVADDGSLIPYAPEGFERLAISRLQEILEQVPDDIRRHVLKNKGGLKEASTRKSSPPAASTNYAPTDAQMIQAALDHISPDVSYDDWLRIGMALHHWDPQAGFAIWDAWSSRGEKYEEGEPPLKWDSFTSGGGVTLGTLFDMAKKSGWEPPAHERTPLPTDEEIAAFMDIDPAALLDQVKSEKQREVLGCLLEAGRPLTPKEISTEIGKDHNATKVLLHRMAKDGKVQSDDSGGYTLGADVTQKGCGTVTLPVTSGENVTADVTPTALNGYISGENVTEPVTSQPNVTVNVTPNVTHPVTTGPNVTGPISKNVTTPDGPRLPTVVVNKRHFRHVRDEAWAVVHASNYPPRLFQRTGSPVCLTFVKSVPEIIPVDSTIMFDHLCSIASWVNRTPEMETPANPPKELPMVMVKRPSPALPHIEAVITVPVFDRHGTLVQAPGYHRDARLWMHRSLEFNVGDVPANPTPGEIDEACRLLRDELLGEFPFATEADRCHAIAALFPTFVRRMIDGPLPIHLIEAPTPGTGKSLLAEAISLLCVGHNADVTTFDKNEEDTRKKITAILASAPQIVLIDNLRKGLLSSQIAAAITANIWTDRLLQTSQMLHLPNLAMWIATGNNPALSMENARRSIRIRLDAKMDRPGQRRGFKHHPLRQWVLDNRPTLVRAVLTIVQGWIAAGKPGTDQVLGSFESWTDVVGGILKWCGVPGFLANTEELMEAADSEGNEWREFVSAWWEKFGDRWVIATQLLELALADDYLPGALGDKSTRSQKTRLGIALQSMRDRQFAQWRIVARRATRGHRAEYRLAQVNSGESGDDSGPEVLSLFGRPSPRSTAGLPQGLPNIPLQNQEDADVVDLGRPISTLKARGEDESASYAPAHITPPNKVYQGIKVYPPVENKEENRGRPLVDLKSRSTNPPSGDLADFEPTEEENK